MKPFPVRAQARSYEARLKDYGRNPVGARLAGECASDETVSRSRAGALLRGERDDAQLDCCVTSTYIMSFCPGRRILFLSMLFQRTNSDTDTRKRLAIRYSESPLLTV